MSKKWNKILEIEIILKNTGGKTNKQTQQKFLKESKNTGYVVTMFIFSYFPKDWK